MVESDDMMVRHDWTEPPVKEPAELVSAFSKVGRAGEHIDVLHHSIAEWVGNNHYVLRRISNLDFTEFRWVLELPSIPLVRWGLFVGEVFFNLRSALDHAVYGIAVKLTGHNPPPNERDLFFPITDSPEKFDTAMRRLAKPFEQVQQPDVRAMLERLQPYHDGAGGILAEDLAHVEGLSLIRDLNNNDKHKLIHPVRICCPASSARPLTYSGQVGKWTFVIGEAKDGATAAQFTVSRPSPQMDVEFTDPMHVTVLGLPMPATQMLVSLYDETFNIVCWLRKEVWGTPMPILQRTTMGRAFPGLTRGSRLGGD